MLKKSKREQLNIIDSKYKFGRSADIMVSMLKKKNQDFYYRKTDYMQEVVVNNTSYMFPLRNKENGFPTHQLWLFGTVKNDAIKFIQRNPNWEMPTKYPVNFHNVDYDDKIGIITGTDIDSAYWEIAYKIGVISERTWMKATFEEYKKVRLASLAILGRKLAYKHFQGRKELDNFVLDYQVDELRNVYKAIRYICYNHMQELAKILGEDFECYKTDCIYYRDTKENRRKVYDYLDNEGFSYKQLVFGPDDNLENPE